MPVIRRDLKRKISYPTDDPEMETIRNKGLARWNRGDMKFENEAEKRDYIKRVQSNKFNTIGYPAFYPPERIKPLYVGDIPPLTEEQLQKIEIEKKRTALIKDVDLFCMKCDKITSHSISPDQAFCHDCGRLRPDYADQYTEIIKGSHENT